MTLETLRHGTRATYRVARYRLMSAILRRAPVRQVYMLGRWHGRRHYRKRRPALQHRVDDMCRRLELTPTQADAVLMRYYELAASEQLDRHLYPRMSAEEIGRLIEIRGLEHLDEALAQGNGAILCSGHVMGHFTFFTALALLGYQLSMVGFEDRVGAEAQAAERVATRQNAFMEDRLGVHFIRMRGSNFGVAVEARNALRANRVVTFEIDHSTAKERVEVDFLGDPGYFPSGHATIARLSGAPLLHFWIRRPDRWLPQIVEIGPPCAVDDDVDAVRGCAAAIERSVIEDPPSWLPWLYSRRDVWEPDEQREPGEHLDRA